MSMSRWKVLACTLTVGVGGLAVFATPPMGDKNESPKEPAVLPDLSVKPTTPTSGDDTPAPSKPVPINELNLDVPSVPTVQKTEEPTKKPASEPVFEPVTPSAPPTAILPVKAEEPKPEDKKSKPASGVGLEVPGIPLPDIDVPVRASGSTRIVPAAATTDDLTPSVPAKPAPPGIPGKPDNVLPPVIDLDVQLTPPAPPATSKPPSPAPTKEPAASSPGNDKVLPPIASDPVPPSRPTAEPVPMSTGPATPGVAPLPPVGPAPMRTDSLVPVAPGVGSPKVPMTNMPDIGPTATKPAEAAKLKLLLRVGDGQPRFEIRNSASSELLLKVYGEKVEMQSTPDSRSSLAGVTAMGRVKFTAPGIEGTCDHLTILSGTGEVLMKGNIRMKTKHGKSWSELTAEKMVYQIGTNGLASPGARSEVRPASYIPD